MNMTEALARYTVELAHQAAGFVAERDSHEEFSAEWMAADVRVARIVAEADGAGQMIPFVRLLNDLTAKPSTAAR